MIAATEVKDRMNQAGATQQPFVFGINFEMTQGFFIPAPRQQQEIFWQIGCAGNFTAPPQPSAPYSFYPCPVSNKEYRKKFGIVQQGLLRGDSFLLNLTERTEINTHLSLEEIFYASKAPYRIWMPEQFVCFSPETFVTIDRGQISSFPMKGTIDASLPGAAETILNDYKEKAEHNTIVDLIRNDLNQVAREVRVKRFRYIDRIQTGKGGILQVSSEISGNLPDNYLSQLGDILFKLLPAGSVSGAPKASTLNLITRVEQCPRGFYTGIFGYFDGQKLDSAVLIRFIEQSGDKLYFRSGGGITVNSRCEDEYREILEKIYLPF